jgi:hypothetical protein
MMIIGVDYHPSFQQIGFFVEETGECGEQRLNHDNGEAEKFYRELKQRGISVRVGMEATGSSRWFERERKTTLRSEGARTFKKYLTEPTLLEISGNRCFTGT